MVAYPTENSDVHICRQDSGVNYIDQTDEQNSIQLFVLSQVNHSIISTP